tara:strand:+ start:56 stop:766 length:711 start_codon:yes stop_codon:yes gene_type:complete
MSRQDRIAQLMALLNDAESSGDDDKIIEIKSDIFKEFGIEKNMGGMMNMDDMTMPLGYQEGTRDGNLVGDKEAMIKVFNLAKANNPDGRISDQDFKYAQRQISGLTSDPVGMATIDDLISNKENRIKKEGRISDPERMMMLRASMRDDVNKTMKEPDVISIALQIAKSQGDTSQENVDFIIRQLDALVPSVMQTTEKQTTPVINQGIQALLEKSRVMTGQQSDPIMNRSVGFGRVK